MDAALLLKACADSDISFFTGVPDSQLKGLCDTLYAVYGTGSNTHVVAANEGNAVGLAAGHYLATGHPALVYMQNSGLGNIVNPVASMLNEKVYGIPCLFVVGWRGEPGVHDEPQHIYQGAVTLEQLELLGIRTFIIGKDTTDAQFLADFDAASAELAGGHCAAFVVRKGGLTCSAKPEYASSGTMTREEAAGILLTAAGDDLIVSTTGKLSREIYELRDARGQGHAHDFLTVGSMGHASSIALGAAMAQPDRRVWCLDGDGAALMHMGAMAVMGQKKPANMIHIVINNGAHETVGGMPVCNGAADWCAMAKAAGYPVVLSADTPDGLEKALQEATAANTLSFIEVRCASGARADLGRPATTPTENRDALMHFLGVKA